jgi:hypothetical protein
MNRFKTLSANFKNTFICGLFLFLLTACAGQNMHSEGPDTKDKAKIKIESVTLKPSGMHEECFELKKQQKLFYNFNSDKPVDFNVHFHAEDVVHYPVQKNGATQSEGMIDPEDKSFQLNTQEYYCLMWENPEIGTVNLSYECITK